MHRRGFSNINWEATYKITKALLEDYENQKMLAARFSIWLKSPAISDMPGGGSVSNSNEDKLTGEMEDADQARFKVELMERTIEIMHTIDDRHEIYADLLMYRYISGMPIKEVRQQLESDRDYAMAFPERTYNDLLHDAVWSFAMIYPSDDIRIKVRR